MTEDPRLSEVVDSAISGRIYEHIWDILFLPMAVGHIRRTLSEQDPQTPEYNPFARITELLPDSPYRAETHDILFEYIRAISSGDDNGSDISAREFIGVLVALRNVLPQGEIGDPGRQIIEDLQERLRLRDITFQDDGLTELNAIVEARALFRDNIARDFISTWRQGRKADWVEHRALLQIYADDFYQDPIEAVQTYFSLVEETFRGRYTLEEVVAFFISNAQLYGHGPDSAAPLALQGTHNADYIIDAIRIQQAEPLPHLNEATHEPPSRGEDVRDDL